MKLFKLMKDGGPMSKSWGYFLIEWKSLFSIVLLRFEDGSREAYHTHAFNAVSWVLRGKLVEHRLDDGTECVFVREFVPSIIPIYTSRDNFHKVVSVGRTWAISFRGPWANRWREYLPDEDRFLTLTHGRKIVA